MSNDDLLKILEAHGQQFLQSFDTPVVIGKRKEVQRSSSERSAKKKRTEEDEDEEWGGIQAEFDQEGDEEDDSDTEDEEADPDETLEDDDFTYESHLHQPAVVVFSETSTSSKVPRNSKSGFMSSKVTKLMQEITEKPSEKQTASDEEDDDLTNAQNDALLHRLVHTQLLSGALNTELDLTPAQRKKALAGRVMEAAGKVKLGKGEAAVRQAERNRASKHVRDGLLEKQKERREKQLEDAKHLGNYHPKLKALYEDSLDTKTGSKKRDRGLKMGVGSFKDGILRLGKNEISAVEGRNGGSRGRGSHRGRRGGKR